MPRRLLLPFILLATGLFPVAATAQDMATAEADKQEYVSVRIKVWSKYFRTIGRQGYDLQGELRISTSVFRFKTLDEFLERDTELINSVGIRPKINFEFPTPVKNVHFTPALEAAFNEAFNTGNQVLSGAAFVGFTHRRKGDPNNIRTRLRLKYGSDYELDGLNFDDYLELNLRVDFQRFKLFDSSKRRYTIRPYVEASRFVDDIELESGNGALFDIDTTYELGLAFGNDPRFRVWGIKMPEVKISYVFGGDFKGIKIRL